MPSINAITQKPISQVADKLVDKVKNIILNNDYEAALGSIEEIFNQAKEQGILDEVRYAVSMDEVANNQHIFSNNLLQLAISMERLEIANLILDNIGDDFNLTLCNNYGLSVMHFLFYMDYYFTRLQNNDSSQEARDLSAQEIKQKHSAWEQLGTSLLDKFEKLPIEQQLNCIKYNGQEEVRSFIFYLSITHKELHQQNSKVFAKLSEILVNHHAAEILKQIFLDKDYYTLRTALLGENSCFISDVLNLLLMNKSYELKKFLNQDGVAENIMRALINIVVNESSDESHELMDVFSKILKFFNKAGVSDKFWSSAKQILEERIKSRQSGTLVYKTLIELQSLLLSEMISSSPSIADTSGSSSKDDSLCRSPEQLLMYRSLQEMGFPVEQITEVVEKETSVEAAVNRLCGM